MTIRILVIDDELGRLDYKRGEFISRWSLFGDRQYVNEVEFTFITGQRTYSDHIVNDVQIAVEYIENTKDYWSIVLLDMQFDYGELVDGEPQLADPQFGLKIQETLELKFPSLPIVQFTAQSQSDLARQDGYYLSKIDGTVDDLRSILVERGRISESEKCRLLQIPETTIVNAPSIIKLYADVFRRARTGMPLLVRGETGTGKEHLAKYFHEMSPNAQGPLVAVQISALSAELYESQLFGYEKGAFTGAEKAHAGLFAEAAGGTLFLDEIGALSPDLQAKLLRVIGERRYRRIGGNTDQSLQCGLIAATQDDLESIDSRNDLWARFDTVTVPPLRERPQDIPKLAERFLIESQERNGKKGIKLSEESVTLLVTQQFPENARGLRKVIEQAVIQLSSNSVIQPRHLNIEIPFADPITSLTEGAAQATSASEEGDKLYHDIGKEQEGPLGDIPSAPVQRRTSLTLKDLMALLHDVKLNFHEHELNGAMSDFDESINNFKRDLVFAALICCRHKVSGKLNVLAAMQLISGDSRLTPTIAKRKLNEYFGRNGNSPIDKDWLVQQLDGWISRATNSSI